ncbi:MAG: DUF2199 domain-containing protein [Propionibacteriaceae bacterium]|nr:DUF2199 domain-containing protein [Propionibacteriaceae bacterium]
MARLSGTSRTSCTTCEVVHSDVATILGPTAPDAWARVSEGERLEAELTPDVCILPSGGLIRYFVRGHLQLPLTDIASESFTWSAWVELDEASMRSVACTWSDVNRAASPPLTGRLATELPYQEPTSGLPVIVYTRDVGDAPLLMVSPGSSHELATEQRDGVDLHRAAEFACLLHH